MHNALVVLALLAALVVVPACGSSTPSAPTTPPNQTPAVSACGAVNAQRIGAAAILNGTQCAAGSSPVVLFRSTDANNLQYVCSGTVIAPRAVLTAKHCVDGISKLAISWGTVDAPNSDSSNFRLSATADVAVVFITTQDFPQTPVSLLVSRDPQVGETAVIAGYGQTQAGTGAGTVLRAGTTTISAVNTAAASIQTQYNGGTTGSGVCYGDSGGPLLVSQGGAWALAGVTSSLEGGNSCSATTNNYVAIRNAAVQSFIASAVPNFSSK